MGQTFHNYKTIIREHLHSQTPELLAELLDYTRAGKLRWNSCCCLAGFGTNKEVKRHRVTDWNKHRPQTGDFMRVSEAYRYLACSDVKRRRILIPMILVEIKHRLVIARVTHERRVPFAY